MSNEFEVLYYTDGIISSKRTLTRLCLLFDKVYTFWLSPDYYFEPLEDRWKEQKKQPFFSKAPVNVKLATRTHVDAYDYFIESNEDLIQEKVLAPIVVNQTPSDWEGLDNAESKLMNDGSAINFGRFGLSLGLIPDEQNTIYVDSPLYSLYRWQSIAGGLHLAIGSGLMPISDNDALTNLACETVSRFSDMKHIPTIEEIQNMIAFASLSLVVPDLSELEPDEILEARLHLGPQLNDFRREIRLVSRELLAFNSIDSNVIGPHVGDMVQPRIDDLVNRIGSLRGNLWSKIAQSAIFGGPSAPLVCQIFGTPGLITWVSSALIKTAFDVLQYRRDKRDLLLEPRNRGLVYLLDIQRKYAR